MRLNWKFYVKIITKSTCEVFHQGLELGIVGLGRPGGEDQGHTPRPGDKAETHGEPWYIDMFKPIPPEGENVDMRKNVNADKIITNDRFAL